MIFSTVSIKQVIARVIRNTRITDTSFLQDMNEWIPEAMGYMRTDMELSPRFKDVVINFHKGALPCGLISIAAVEYQGRRLGLGQSVKHIMTGHSLDNQLPSLPNLPNSPTLFTSVINTSEVPNGNFLFGSDLIPTADSLAAVLGCDVHPTNYYQVEMDYINTSMADAIVRVHYLTQPMDEDDMPLIPDNENYKEALYYYVRAKMVGTGYKDTVFTEDELMKRFEGYAARAIGQIKYPTPDMKQKQLETLTRFISPENYWENFFRVDSAEQNYQ